VNFLNKSFLTTFLYLIRINDDLISELRLLCTRELRIDEDERQVQDSEKRTEDHAHRSTACRNWRRPYRKGRIFLLYHILVTADRDPYLRVACVRCTRVRTRLSALVCWKLTFTPREYVAHVALSSLFFQIENGETKCPECYTSLPVDEKENYLGVLRHYIHLGFPERFEICNECSVSLAIVCNFTGCRDCPEILEEFLNYLNRTEVHLRPPRNRLSSPCRARKSN